MDKNNIVYVVEENLLKIGGTSIPFKYKINEAIPVFDMLIIRLESPRDVVFNENVFGVNMCEKKIKWQIANLRYDTGVDCPFVGVKFSDGRLYLNNWCDIYLIVDPLTGEILERSLPAKY
jgi:hypothetical protein